MVLCVEQQRAGTFDDAGVRDLNRRAEAVMMGLGVPMINNYDFTQGQSWATIPADGRYGGRYLVERLLG